MKIDDPVVAININRHYQDAKNNEEKLYNCTRSLWRINRARANKAKYAFAVYNGVIREVYKIDEWVPGREATIQYWLDIEKAKGTGITRTTLEGRSAFVGGIAPDGIRDKYRNRPMPERHGQTPICYYNC